MEKALFFDALTVNGEPDRTYSASDIAAMRRAYYDDGVLSADALAVEANDAMSVTVSPGAAVIAGYTYILDEEKTLTLAATNYYPRNDVIVLRLDLAERTIAPVVHTGLGSEQPNYPGPVCEGNVIEFALAHLALPANATAASEATLNDLRPFAAARVTQAPFAAMIAGAIAALPKLGESELAAVRGLLSRIATSGTGARVLCDDGRYREAHVTERVELARYDEAGEYEFDPAEHPSANGLYDVEVLGAGGAGGSVLAENSRGGGGGAGVCVTVSSLRVPGKTAVTVGAGGVGVSGAKGGNGGESAFGQIYADGGTGGSGGAYLSGGSGGVTSPYSAENGKDGSRDVPSAAYPDECGAGGASVFGAGAPGSDNTEVSFGANASKSGAGGSGAGGPSSLSALLAGGRGADGAVIVYGFAAPTEGE